MSNRLWGELRNIFSARVLVFHLRCDAERHACDGQQRHMVGVPVLCRTTVLEHMPGHFANA